MGPILLLLFAQSSAPSSRPAATLEEWVERASAAQFPGGTGLDRKEAAELSLAFDFLVRDEERSHEVAAVHSFRLPNLVRTTLDDAATGTKVATGFDGARHWVRDEKGTSLLEGRENRDAREEIDERVRLSRDLAAVFCVRALLARLEGKVLLPGETREGRAVRGIEGETAAFGPIREAGTERVALRLTFDAESADLLEALARPLAAPGAGPPPEVERFAFSEFRTKEGLRHPGRITVTVGEAKRPTYEIRRIRDVRLNPGLAADFFAPPK